MATYITLLQFTQKGVENIKEGPKRLEAAKKLFRQLGGEMKAFYLTMGRYDAVAIFEAPDATSVATGALAAASKGTVKTETMLAFSEQEYGRIVDAIP
jgi:uncharacterized protein with GYD domain